MNDYDFRGTREAVLCSTLSGLEKLLLLVLVEHMPTCRPGLERLSTLTSLHRTTVIHLLTALESRGVLVVTRTKGRGNLYRIADEGLGQPVPVAERYPSSSATSSGALRVPVAERYGGGSGALRVPVAERYLKQDLKQDLKQEAEAATRPRARAHAQPSGSGGGQSPPVRPHPEPATLADSRASQDHDVHREPEARRTRQRVTSEAESRMVTLGESIAREMTIHSEAAQPTSRVQKARLLVASLPISELARHCREHPNEASVTDVHRRPEVVQINAAWAEAVGLPVVALTPYSRGNRPLTAILTLLEGNSVETLLRACDAASRDPWCRGEIGTNGQAPRKHGVEELTPIVLQKLLDSDSEDLDPRIAEMLDVERKRYANSTGQSRSTSTAIRR